MSGLYSPPAAEKRQQELGYTVLGMAVPLSNQLRLTRFIFSVPHVTYSLDLYLH